MTHDYKAVLDMIALQGEVNKSSLVRLELDELEIETIRHALKLAIALQPKPMSEYKGQDIALIGRLQFNQWEYLTLAYKAHDDWFIIGDMDDDGQAIIGQDEQPTHFYDISALPKPEGAE